ncbi:hypothetical protein F2P81_008309 [Scophthalmus maximus]|uniref:Uncharacterized protein n=1 Tax=Scophthalmus maximus TaxID=52904 RepID=A0A6A4TA80_SCOMX|nr:hypothetical protein F2P81_008309 [Scophthalmus maximus]
MRIYISVVSAVGCFLHLSKLRKLPGKQRVTDAEANAAFFPPKNFFKSLILNPTVREMCSLMRYPLIRPLNTCAWFCRYLHSSDRERRRKMQDEHSRSCRRKAGALSKKVGDDDIELICAMLLFALRDLGSIGKHDARSDSSEDEGPRRDFAAKRRRRNCWLSQCEVVRILSVSKPPC